MERLDGRWVDGVIYFLTDSDDVEVIRYWDVWRVWGLETRQFL